MKHTGKHLLWLWLPFWVVSLAGVFAGNGDPTALGTAEKNEQVYSESEVRARFKAMPSIVKKRYSGTTKKKLRSYLDTGRTHTEELLGKGSMFFPIIEQYLKAYDLPMDLRVLPIIETKLDPTAISHAGATGLWQFMEGTAVEFGLTVDQMIDERIDIHRSTEAAVQYLARLYEKYEDWGLALAAYNCGPGHVNRAIRRAGSRDYWAVAPFLPRETQKYIPKFLAATYLVNYYHEHGLVPTFPDLDLQITQDLRIFKSICFDELARIAQVSEDILHQLNPAYPEECLPARSGGVLVTLPRRSARFVAGYLQMPVEGQKYFQDLVAPVDAPTELDAAGYRIVWYTPDSLASLSGIAREFNVEESLLYLWNALEPDPLFNGHRELKIFIPEVRAFHLPKPKSIRILPQIGAQIASEMSVKMEGEIVDLMRNVRTKESYATYTLGIADTPEDICRVYPEIDRKDLFACNPKAMWIPGEIIRVPTVQENIAVR